MSCGWAAIIFRCTRDDDNFPFCEISVGLSSHHWQLHESNVIIIAIVEAVSTRGFSLQSYKANEYVSRPG